MVLDGKSSQEYPVNAGVFFVLYYFLFTLMIFLKMFSMIVLSADDTTLYSKCNQASNLRQQLELASELECDL